MLAARLAAGLAAALLSTAGAAAAPPVYAVVVGIDDYQALPKLNGAVNDARSLERALRANGAAEVVTLIDAQASRASFENAVRQMAAKAAANGGWLAITYAGHGGQEPERIEGDETDAQDEVLLFPGFLTAKAGNGERLPDNEIRALLETIPASVNVLFLVDACHSGTMTRAPDPRSAGLTYRNAPYGAIEDDQLPPPPLGTKGKEASELPNVLFVASALDSEKTPEVEIDGVKHGAVSWHLARALQGGADANGDGVTTFAELRQFLVVAPRALAQGRQTPGVYYFPGRDGETFPLAPARMAVAPPAEAAVSVWSLGGPPVSAAGARPAASAAEADLLWDAAKGEVVDNRTGDLIAQQAPSADASRMLSGVIDKQRALQVLFGLVANDPLALDLGPRGAGARYAAEKVAIEIKRPQTDDLRFLTVFNIAGDGTVQHLFPSSAQEAAAQSPGIARSFNNNVKPPYGADHVVAVATASDPVELRALLEGLNGQQAAAQAAGAVARLQRDQRAAVGVVGLFTGRD